MYTVEQLCIRLNIPMSVLFDEQKDDERISIISLKQRCRKHVYDKNYDKLSEDLRKLKEETSNMNNYLDHLFIVWHEAIILHKLNRCSKQAKEILLKSLPDKYVLETEIAMANTLGLICASSEETDEALHYFKKAYMEIKNITDLDDQTLYVRVVYNYASQLFYLKDYEQVIILANQLISYLKNNHLFYMRGRTFHMLGKTYEKMSDFVLAEKYMLQAISVFAIEELPDYLKKAEEDLTVIRSHLV